MKAEVAGLLEKAASSRRAAALLAAQTTWILRPLAPTTHFFTRPKHFCWQKVSRFPAMPRLSRGSVRHSPSRNGWILAFIVIS